MEQWQLEQWNACWDAALLSVFPQDVHYSLWRGPNFDFHGIACAVFSLLLKKNELKLINFTFYFS